ncbi:hypothetical protein KKG81_04860 [bacterium]|nr:hypothetical protein [bacterium]
MVNRSNLGRRSRINALKKLNQKKRANPEKYNFETTERSIYLGMKYDHERGVLANHKIKKFEKLKEKYGGKNGNDEERRLDIDS